MQAIDFNKGWFFHKDGEEESRISINLPHDAQLAEPRSADMPMDSGFFPRGQICLHQAIYLWKKYG